MEYKRYLFKSLEVFIVCFVLGVIIDRLFVKLQVKYNTIHRSIYAFSQLITIISVTYIINRFFRPFFEEYSPHILFSSFLLSLQTNMIMNFKELI